MRLPQTCEYERSLKELRPCAEFSTQHYGAGASIQEPVRRSTGVFSRAEVVVFCEFSPNSRHDLSALDRKSS